MKNQLLPLLASALLLASAAQAQDKPALNTAPPGATPPPVQPQPSTPASPAATPPPTAPTAAPTPQPSTDKPSGLDLPSDRDARAAGGSSSELSRKLFIYSNFGLGYSGYDDYSQFNFSIAPALGYRISEKFALGPGVSYTYNNYSFGRNYPSLSTSSYGIKAFAQFIFYKQFFAHAEYEVTSAELLEVDSQGFLTGGKRRRSISTPLAGAGYREQFSDRVAADILILYNFGSTINSIYPNPVYRISFLFNLGR